MDKKKRKEDLAKVNTSLLRMYMSYNKITYQTLANKTGVSKSTVERIMKIGTCRYKNLQKIAEYFRLDYKNFTIDIEPTDLDKITTMIGGKKIAKQNN